MSYIRFRISDHEVPVEAFFGQELSTFLPQYLNEVPGIVCTAYCMISSITFAYFKCLTFVSESLIMKSPSRPFSDKSESHSDLDI